ncbi:glycosyltransferase family 2 protein [Patescibacteria group bacterium]|nr:glycosyltransferase family 2 protein [Patescibacteria group bacterium]
MKLSIIIPAYNEEEGIEKVISELKETVDQEYEIIVVNDGSTDQTENILENIKDIKLINHPYNKGYGASLKSGIRKAQGEYILIIDGDGTYPVNEIPKLLKYVNNYDMVSGMRKGKNFDARWFYSQRLAKFILKKIASYVTKTKIPDINCGLRIFKKEIIEKYWDLYPQGFSFTTTSLVAFLANDYQVKFVSIDYHGRKGKSTLKPFKSFVGFINLILKLSLFFKPIKVFLPLGIFIFLVAIGITIYGFVWKNIFYDTSVILLSATALQTFFFGLLAEIIVHNRK